MDQLPSSHQLVLVIIVDLIVDEALGLLATEQSTSLSVVVVLIFFVVVQVVDLFNLVQIVPLDSFFELICEVEIKSL